MYAGVREDEREAIFREMTEQEDTAMLAQYIKDKGFQEGKLEGKNAPILPCEVGRIRNIRFHEGSPR